METEAERQRGTQQPTAQAAGRRKIWSLRGRLPDAACDGGVMARVEPARALQPGGAVDPREVDGVLGGAASCLRY